MRNTTEETSEQASSGRQLAHSHLFVCRSLSSMIIHKISMVQKQNRLNKQDYFFVFVFFFFFFAFYTNNSISSEMNITCCHSLTHSNPSSSMLLLSQLVQYFVFESVSLSDQLVSWRAVKLVFRCCNNVMQHTNYV